jgi:hypothetical protein
MNGCNRGDHRSAGAWHKMRKLDVSVAFPRHQGIGKGAFNRSEIFLSMLFAKFWVYVAASTEIRSARSSVSLELDASGPIANRT